MIDGLYSAASGMNAQQGRMDSISVDLANLNTIGYKSQHYGFLELLYQAQGPNRSILGGGVGSGVAGGIIDRAMTQGAINGTTNPFDLAIEGAGFFQVRLADGTIGLTRDGNFTLDSSRRLATTNGNLLVPNLTIPADVPIDDVAVAADGTVSVSGKQIGKVVLVNVAAPERLTSLGSNLFAVNTNSGTARVGGTGVIKQRALEGSNTDVAQSLTDMIQTQRAYDLCSRAVRTWDDMLQTANQIKR